MHAVLRSVVRQQNSKMPVRCPLGHVGELQRYLRPLRVSAAFAGSVQTPSAVREFARNRPVCRQATIQFKDFSSQFEVKATVRSGVVFKPVARKDGLEVTLEDLIKTYTAELVGLD